MKLTTTATSLVTAPIQSLASACSSATEGTKKLITATSVAFPTAFTLGCSGDPSLFTCGGAALVAGTASLYLALRKKTSPAKTDLPASSHPSEPSTSPVLPVAQGTADSTASQDPWLNCEQHLSSRIFKPVILFYEDRFGAAKLDELIAGIGTTREILEDPDRWFSVERVLKFLYAMIAATGDPLITYKAGLAFGEPNIMGPQRFLIRAAGTPQKFFEALPGFTRDFSKVTKWIADKVGKDSARVTFKSQPGIPDDITFCLNRRGVLEASATLFGLPRAVVNHPECLHKDGDKCVYDVRWVNRPSRHNVDIWGGGILLASAAILNATGFVSPEAIMAGTVPILAALRLASWQANNQLRTETERFTREHIAELQGLLKRYQERIAENERLTIAAQQALSRAQKFSLFLPKTIVEEIQNNPELALQLGGKDTELAIMFCDIASFTPMSAASSSNEVVKALNIWFANTDPLLKMHGGIIDKRIGDCILAVFLKDDSGIHPVLRAVAASIAMQKGLDTIRADLERVAPEFTKMKIRIALHFGTVATGNMGSSQRMEFTIIGNEVNVAARIEGVTPAGEIFLTGAALLAAGGSKTLPNTSFVTHAKLKGVQELVPVYRVSFRNKDE